MNVLDRLRGVYTASAYNQWAGFELLSAADGQAELAVKAKPELLQHAGLLHAGVLGALIDTVCGFAAASNAGAVLTSHYSVRCYRSGKGERFVARARVVKSGKRQVFTTAQVFALEADGEVLIAGGDAILVPVT